MKTTTQAAGELEDHAPLGLELDFPWASPMSNVRPRSARSLSDEPVLSIRARVPTDQASVFVTDALHAIRVYLQEHHVQPAGPPFSISRPSGAECDIEAGWPTTVPVQGSGRIHGGALPRSLLQPETH
jgi:hypothetical protein